MLGGKQVAAMSNNCKLVAAVNSYKYVAMAVYRAVFTLEAGIRWARQWWELKSDGSEDEFDGYLEKSERIDEDELEEETSSKSPERSVADGAGDDDMNGAIWCIIWMVLVMIWRLMFLL